MNARSPSKGEESDIVVFRIVRDSKCSECGEELGRGRWLRMEEERVLVRWRRAGGPDVGSIRQG
jgi:hypothetical protein